MLCGFCAQRSPGAPAVESVRLQPGLLHGLSRGNLSRTPASNHSLKVVRQRHRFAAGVLALLFGNRDALTLTLQDILAFKLRDCCKDSEHEFAGRCGRVDCLLAADELDLLLGQSFHEIKQVARVSRKTAD